MRKKIIISCLFFIICGCLLILYCGIETIKESSISGTKELLGIEEDNSNPAYNNKYSKYNQYQKIKREEFYYLTNERGRKITGRFSKLYPAGNNFFTAEKNKKQGVINEKGKTIIPFKYDKIAYQRGYFFAQKDNKWGIIDENSKILVPFEYENMPIDSAGQKNTFWVKKNGKYGAVNLQNEIIKDFVFYSIPQKITENRYISGFSDISKEDAQKLYKEGVVVPELVSAEEAELDRMIKTVESLLRPKSEKLIQSEGELHCASVYEGNYASAGGQPGPVTVRVTVKTPITLYLSSYEAVTWNVIAEKGAKINKIYYSSYNESTVKAPRGTKIEKINAGDYFEKTAFKQLLSITDKPPVTFQSKYSIRGADEFLIDGKDGADYNVYPKHPVNNGAVSLKCDIGNCSDLTVSYGNAGAGTTASADKYYNKGKYYFEAEFIAPKVYDTPWINIGLLSDYNRSHHCSFNDPSDSGECLHVSIMGWSENSLKNGDIVGIAADFDEGKLYGFVNGKPKNGIIEKKKTIYLFEPGEREYTAGLEVSRDIKWKVNFGAQKFKYKIPDGFKPYDEYSSSKK